MISIRRTSIILSFLSIALFTASAKQEKILQIFKNNKIIQEYVVDSIDHIEVIDKQGNVIQVYRKGEIIQEYSVGEIDYLEVNERLAVPDQIPDDEIWYVTDDGEIYDPTIWAHPFEQAIISNKYYGDHGIIKLDGPIENITKALYCSERVKAIYLPDCVKYMHNGVLGSFTGITSFKVPANLQKLDGNPFRGCYNLTKFTGQQVSEDGRCLVLNDTLYSFAPKGITHYRTPDGIKVIGETAFSRSKELESIELNEGLLNIGGTFIVIIGNTAIMSQGGECFSECTSLKKVTLPSTLKHIDSYAFRGCTAIEGFYGNERFHSSDNQCLYIYDLEQNAENEKTLINFAGHGLTEYSFPEGITFIGNYAISGKMNLRNVTLPNSLKNIGGEAFYDCPNIESINGIHTSSDHRCIVIDGELKKFVAGKGITKYRIPEEIKKIGEYAFSNCELDEISMSDDITEIGDYAFTASRTLKTLTLSASLKTVGLNPFYCAFNLDSIYMRCPRPPKCISWGKEYFFLERAYDNPTIYVPTQAYDWYIKNPTWESYKENFAPHYYADLDINKYLPDYYFSTDFSTNGNVEKLMIASEGNGIDVVLMGDGFSDRQIAEGKYKTVMQKIANAFLEIEPYKSFKEMFNIHIVNVVSSTEGFDYEKTGLGGTFDEFGEGTYVNGDHEKCIQYALKAISEERMDEALIVVAMNKDSYASTTHMYYPSNTVGSNGSGLSISFVSTNSDTETFNGLIYHEVLGHGFAKLGEEYGYDFFNKIPDYLIPNIKSQQSEFGWYKNIDFTSDLSTILWSKFATDSRYSHEKIGAYEGAMCYTKGVWRPQENSIMRDNTGGFNAPSREAIYHRIHKLAYGNNWTYNYEDFVNYDILNRNSEAMQKDTIKSQKPKQSLHAPIIIEKSWREASPTEEMNPSPSSLVPK